MFVFNRRYLIVNSKIVMKRLLLLYVLLKSYVVIFGITSVYFTFERMETLFTLFIFFLLHSQIHNTYNLV